MLKKDAMFRPGQHVKYQAEFCIYPRRRRKDPNSTPANRIKWLNATVLSTRNKGKRVRIELEDGRIRTVSNHSLVNRGLME